MIFLSNRKLRLIIITLLLLIFCFFIGLFRPKAESIESSVYYSNGTTYTMSMGNGTYAGISIKYTIGGVVNPEKFSFYINTGSNSNYKYMSGWIRYKLASQDIKGKPVILYGGNDCVVNDSLSNDVNYVAFTCPNLSGKNWLDIMFQTATINEFYISRNIGYSDIENSNQSTLNSISTSSQDTANNTYYIKEGINDVNDTLNDSSVDTNTASSSASSWNGKNATNGTITQLLTLPITLLQAIVNGISTSCSSFSLGSLFGTNITLPCINLSNLIGSGLFTTIDILFSGFMILAIGKKLIKIFNDFTNLKSNQIDELYGGGK